MKQILFMLIFLSALMSNAQIEENFEKGWIINNDNDKKMDILKTMIYRNYLLVFVLNKI